MQTSFQELPSSFKHQKAFCNVELFKLSCQHQKIVFKKTKVYFTIFKKMQFSLFFFRKLLKSFTCLFFFSYSTLPRILGVMPSAQSTPMKYVLACDASEAIVYL